MKNILITLSFIIVIFCSSILIHSLYEENKILRTNYHVQLEGKELELINLVNICVKNGGSIYYRKILRVDISCHIKDEVYVLESDENWFGIIGEVHWSGVKQVKL